MKVELIQYNDERFYRITHKVDDKDVVTYCASTTTKLSAIAKPGLASWKGDVGNEAANHKMFEAGYRGKRIHKAWELYNQGYTIRCNQHGDLIDTTEPHYDIKYQDEYLDFLKLHEWTQRVKPTLGKSELIVYDLEHKEAGTIDNVMTIAEGTYEINGKTKLKLPGGIYIVDLKTGKQIWDDHYMQVADYAIMYEKLHDVEVAGALIIHTGAQIRTGIVGLATKVRTREELLIDYEDYRHVAAIWERQNKNAQPKQLSFPNMVKKEEV